MAARLGAPAAFLRGVNIASAAHSAAPSFPVVPAVAAAPKGASFASQLLGLTSAAPAKLPTAVGTANAATTEQAQIVNWLPGFTLPKPIAKPTTLSLPLSIGSKRSTADHKQASKPSAQTVETAAVPVPAILPAPTVEVAEPAATEAIAPVTSQPPAAPPVETEDPEELAVPGVSAATAQPDPQDMAFATRVQPVQSTQHSALPAEMASSDAVASATKKVVAAPEDQNASAAPEPHVVPAAIPSTAADHTAASAASTPAPAPHAANAIHRTEAPVSPVDAATKSTTPLKDISLQVNQPGKERVDVRVVQQGNEVHVSVHSGDATLTSGLRQGLSDLQSRLEETGYRSEMWRPGVSSAPVSASPSAQESGNHSRGDEGQQQQQGGSQQESGRRNQQQSNQPHWVEELESSFGGEKASGGFHGFGS